MIEQKQIFEDYLTQLELPEIPHLMGQFEHYHKLLVAQNRDVNLISRKMHPDNYWVQHSGIPPFFLEPNFHLVSITPFLYIWPSFILDNQRDANGDNLSYPVINEVLGLVFV